MVSGALRFISGPCPALCPGLLTGWARGPQARVGSLHLTLGECLAMTNTKKALTIHRQVAGWALNGFVTSDTFLPSEVTLGQWLLL